MGYETPLNIAFGTVLTMLLTIIPCSAQTKDSAGNSVSLPVHPEQAMAALYPDSGPVDLDAETPSAGVRRLLEGPSRGAASMVFPEVAPAVVVVRIPTGYGTGFVIDSDGWILTNNHVIASASIDIDSGSRFAFIHFGDMKEGFMNLNKTSHLAFVHAASAEKDLALLKLKTLPEGRTLNPVRFAGKNADPGLDCITIGHPSRGLFWSVRSGEIVGAGNYPGDMIDSIMPQFTMSVAAQESFAESLRHGQSRKALLSTCGINPGDSGGPLLNNEGELVAVNFAIPKSDKDSQVNLDKFSYHVHLDEVRAFTVNKPEKPEVFRPDYWPPATSSKLMDRDGDDKFETWFFTINDMDPASGILFDLDEDTKPTFVEEFRAGTAKREQFDFEVAYVRIPNTRVFYDRDNDGEVDMILTDTNEDGTSNLTVAKTKGGWEKLPAARQQMLDPNLLTEVSLRERFKTIVLQKPAQPEPPPNALPNKSEAATSKATEPSPTEQNTAQQE
jgi:S1-C subfamily serine protease